MSTTIQYLQRQALSSVRALRTVAPTRLSVQLSDNSSERVEWDFEYPIVADLFCYRSVEHFFTRRSARNHYFQTLAHKHNTSQRKQYANPLLTPEIIAHNIKHAESSAQRYMSEQRHRDLIAEVIRDNRRYRITDLSSVSLCACPSTGIVFTVSLPSIPFQFTQRHPLASIENIKQMVDWFLNKSHNKHRMDELAPEVLAGCLIVMLREKQKLAEEGIEATAINARLQPIGSKILGFYIRMLTLHWHSPMINTMPILRFNAEDQNPHHTLTGFFQLLHEKTSVQQSDTTQAKVHEATRQKTRAERSIKVYSAETKQARDIKESKQIANELYKALEPSMPAVTRIIVRQSIQNFLILSPIMKDRVTEAISRAYIGKPQEQLAKQLIHVISSVSNEHIEDALDSFSQSVSPIKPRSIADILAAKSRNASEE